MGNVVSLRDKRQIEGHYIEIIQSLKFGLYKEIVITEKGTIQNMVLCQYFGHKKSNFFMLHF